MSGTGLAGTTSWKDCKGKGTETDHGRNRRRSFPAGWWILPVTLAGVVILAFAIWLIGPLKVLCAAIALTAGTSFWARFFLK